MTSPAHCGYCRHPIKASEGHMVVHDPNGPSGTFHVDLCWDGARMSGAVVETGLLMADVEASRNWQAVVLETLAPRVSGRCLS